MNEYCIEPAVFFDTLQSIIIVIIILTVLAKLSLLLFQKDCPKPISLNTKMMSELHLKQIAQNIFFEGMNKSNLLYKESYKI